MVVGICNVFGRRCVTEKPAPSSALPQATPTRTCRWKWFQRRLHVRGIALSVGQHPPSLSHWSRRRHSPLSPSPHSPNSPPPTPYLGNLGFPLPSTPLSFLSWSAFLSRSSGDRFEVRLFFFSPGFLFNFISFFVSALCLFAILASGHCKIVEQWKKLVVGFYHGEFQSIVLISGSHFHWRWDFFFFSLSFLLFSYNLCLGLLQDRETVGNI